MVRPALDEAARCHRFIAAAYHSGEPCQCEGRGCPRTCSTLEELNRHVQVTGEILLCRVDGSCHCHCSLPAAQPPQPVCPLNSSPVTSPRPSRLLARHVSVCQPVSGTTALHSACCTAGRYHVLGRPGRRAPSTVLRRGWAKKQTPSPENTHTHTQLAVSPHTPTRTPHTRTQPTTPRTQKQSTPTLSGPTRSIHSSFKQHHRSGHAQQEFLQCSDHVQCSPFIKPFRRPQALWAQQPEAEAPPPSQGASPAPGIKHVVSVNSPVGVCHTRG